MTLHERLFLHSAAHESMHFPSRHERCNGQSALYVHSSSRLHSVSGWPLKPLLQLQMARWLVVVQSVFEAQTLSSHGFLHWRFLHAKLFAHCGSDEHLEPWLPPVENIHVINILNENFPEENYHFYIDFLKKI